MSGSGFKNITDGIAHFFHRLGGEVDEALQATLTALHPSIVQVETIFQQHGNEFLNALTSVMATGALAAVTGGTGTVAEIASAAGKAAIAAGAALAAKEGKEVVSDALHALATAQVTAALSAQAPAPEAAK